MHHDTVSPFASSHSPSRAATGRPASADSMLRSVACDTLDLLPIPAWVVDARGWAEHFNRAWLNQIGIVPLGAGGRGWLHLVHEEDRARVWQRWQVHHNHLHLMQVPKARGAVQLAAFSVDCRLRHQDGSFRWYAINAQPQFNAAGELLRWVGTCTDIHERVLREIDLSQETHARNDMLDASIDCIKIINLEGYISHLNRSGCVALGVPEDSAFGMRWLDLLPPEVHPRGLRALQQARNGRNVRFPGKSQVPGQKPQYWDNILTPVKDEHGKTVRILCVSREVTAQYEAEQRLRIASERDALTGLYNRRSFTTRLRREIGLARRNGTSIGLLLIDLDHFKQTNDALGHAAGDHLLRVLSKRLSQCYDSRATVARLGGDEFVVVLPGVSSDAELIEAANRALAQGTLPVSFGGRLINGGMSIGSALFPRDADDLAMLLKNADTALHDLKAHGRGGVRVFNAGMNHAAQIKFERLSLARQVLQEQCVVPVYRPRVSLHDCRPIALSAQLAWHCGERGVQPSTSIAEAMQDYELASRLSEQLHHRVFADMVSWREQGQPPLPVVLRVASVEFLRDDYASVLLKRLSRFGLEPSRIELQISERCLFDRGAAFTVRALQQLRAAGMRISVSIFGLGLSALTELRQYPVDGLRISAEALRRLNSEETLQAVVRAVVMLGPALGMAQHLVVDGIQSEAEREALLAVGCSVGEGPLFADLPVLEMA